MDKIKKIKVKKSDGTFTDYLPLGSDAEYIDLENGNNLQEEIDHITKSYDNVAAMKADENLKVGDICQTLGYYEVNDGGAATYKIVQNISNNNHQESLNNNLYATLITDDYVAIEQLGAYGDNIHDDTTIIQTATLKYKNIIFNSNYKVDGFINPSQRSHWIINGIINLNGEIDINNSSILIEGNGQISSTNNYCIKISPVNTTIRDIIIKDITLIGNRSNNGIYITNNNSNSNLAIVYIDISCRLKWFNYGIKSYKEFSTNQTWFNALNFNGLIENCSQAIDFTWGGAGSNISGQIQPLVSSVTSEQHSNNLSLIYIKSTTHIDTMIWDMDTALNKVAISIAGTNNIIHSTVSSSYISFIPQTNKNKNFIRFYIQDVLYDRMASCVRTSNFMGTLPYYEYNNLAYRASQENNFCTFTTTPNGYYNEIKNLLNKTSKRFYSQSSEISLDFNFAQPVCLREIGVEGEIMPESIDFYYLDENSEYQHLVNKSTTNGDYQSSWGGANIAYWAYQYLVTNTNFNTKYAYGVRITLHNPSQINYYLHAIFIASDEIIFPNKYGDDLVAQSLKLKANNKTYNISVDGSGNLVATEL